MRSIAKWLVILAYKPKLRSLWTTNDGRKIPVDEMGDEHLLNALRICEQRLIAFAALSKEAKKRGLRPKPVGVLKLVNTRCSLEDLFR